MAYTHVKDIAVKTGSYTKDGQTKGRYLNVGKVLRGDDGKELFMLNTTFNPAGVPNPENRDTVILSIFDVKGNQYNNAPETASNIDDVDSIPF